MRKFTEEENKLIEGVVNGPEANDPVTAFVVERLKIVAGAALEVRGSLDKLEPLVRRGNEELAEIIAQKAGYAEDLLRLIKNLETKPGVTDGGSTEEIS